MIDKVLGSPKIVARLVGLEKGVYAFGIFFVAILCYSLGMFIKKGGYIPLAFAIGAGIGLSILFRHWMKYSPRSEEREYGRTTLLAKPDGELQIDAPSPEKVIKVFSTITKTIQNRKPLEPYGEIGTDVRDKKSLKQYSPAEREKIKKTIEQEIQKQDEKTYYVLKDAMQRLQIPYEGEAEQKDEGEIDLKGVPTAEET